MYKNKRVLAIIPARGGSKGLPKKNVKMLNGKPLIAWTIEQAKFSRFVDEIFVTTDSAEIAEIAKLFDAEPPILRPAELATDTASSVDVVNHVINYFKSNSKNFDYILLLEPTSPLRKKDDIDNVIKLAVENNNADGVISVGEIHLEHPMIVKKINTNGFLTPYIDNVINISQRQQADKAYFPYGVSYLIKTNIFEEKKSFYTNKIKPYFIERWQNFEIDDIVDFEIIELLITKYLK